MAYGSKTVTTSATEILSANTKRKGFIIGNTSTKVAYIGPDNSITVNNAIPLYQYQNLTKDKIPEGWLGPIYAIVENGTADLRYWEFSL